MNFDYTPKVQELRKRGRRNDGRAAPARSPIVSKRQRGLCAAGIRAAFLDRGGGRR